MWDRFEQSLARHDELERLLADPEVSVDVRRSTALAKEHGALRKSVEPYKEFKKLDRDAAQAEAMLAAESDPEMRAYAEEELASLRARRDALRARLEDLLLVEPGEDFGSVIVEIRAGTGGDEEALFAGDLYGLDTHYARDRGWKVEDSAFSPGDEGGW